MKYETREITSLDDRSYICEKILRSLPDWFGIEESLIDYVNQARILPTYAVFDGDIAVGFASIKPHSAYTAEINVMAVLPEYHRKGIGVRLVDCCEQHCHKNKMEFLTVKTLDELAKSEPYDKTRQFYYKMGFKPLEVFPLLWDESNPCLFLVKHIDVDKER